MRRRTLLRSAAVATVGTGVVTANRGRGGQGTTTEGAATTADGETTTVDGATETTAGGGQFALSSSAFDNGGTIPTRFTCDGENVSPPLSIADPPEETQSFALLLTDPDAPSPPFVHWLLWDLPADVREIPANVPNSPIIDSLGGAKQGTNGAGEIGYTGPCPPEGDPRHTYLFSLFALEESLGLDPGADYERVLDALFPRAIARSRLVGQYARG